MIINIFKYRNFILKTSWWGFKNRYAGASMGLLWNILQPLALILLYFTVFSTVFAFRIGETEENTTMFALYLCSGFLAWNAFTECAIYGANAFINNAIYLKKLPIPEQVFVTKEAIVATYSLVISFFLLFILSVFFKHFPSWTWLLLPLPLILFQCFAFGLGMFLGIINVFFKDVGHSLPIIFQIWFWLTPIVYPISILPEFMQNLMAFNPAFHYITAIRDIFLYHQFPDISLWVFMIGWSLATPFIAYLTLRRLRPEIRDCI